MEPFITEEISTLVQGESSQIFFDLLVKIFIVSYHSNVTLAIDVDFMKNGTLAYKGLFLEP